MSADPSRIIRFRFGVGEFSQAAFPQLPVRPPMRLTPGERQVIAMLLQRKTDAQIARTRGTSVRTVLNQLSSILRKVEVGSREELLRRLGGA